MISPQSIHPGPSNARHRADPRRDRANLEPRARSSVPSQFRRVEQPLFRHAISRVARITLLPPWVTIEVIAEAFPKARLVGWHQRQALHPFGALPKIKVR